MHYRWLILQNLTIDQMHLKHDFGPFSCAAPNLKEIRYLYRFHQKDSKLFLKNLQRHTHLKQKDIEKVMGIAFVQQVREISTFTWK